MTEPKTDSAKPKVKVDAEWHSMDADRTTLEKIKARKQREMQQYPSSPHEPCSSERVARGPQRAQRRLPSAPTAQPNNVRRNSFNRTSPLERPPPTSRSVSRSRLAARGRPHGDIPRISQSPDREIRKPAAVQLNSPTRTEPDVQRAAYLQHPSHQRQQTRPAAFEGNAAAEAESNTPVADHQKPPESLPTRDPEMIEITTSESSLRLLGFVEDGDGRTAAMVDVPPQGPRLVRAGDTILWKDKQDERTFDVREVTRRELKVKVKNEYKTIYFRK